MLMVVVLNSIVNFDCQFGRFSLLYKAQIPQANQDWWSDSGIGHQLRNFVLAPNSKLD